MPRGICFVDCCESGECRFLVDICCEALSERKTIRFVQEIPFDAFSVSVSVCHSYFGDFKFQPLMKAIFSMRLTHWLSNLFSGGRVAGLVRRRRALGLRSNRTARQVLQHRRESECLEDRTLLSNISIGETIYETIGTTGDLDQFSFTLSSASRVYVDGLSTFGSVVWSL